MSLLPSSYPGNNILTEDLGVICPSQTCTCNFKGKDLKLKVDQRVRIRGCANI